MRLAFTKYGGQQIMRRIPLFGNGTDIQAGAAVMRGATAGTNQAYGIVAASTIPGFIGVAEAKFAASVKDNDPSVATKYLFTPVTVNPDGVYAADYDQTTNLTIASILAGNPTVTSLEDVSGGFLLAVGASSPGVGYLSFVESVSAGAATLRDVAPATAWTTATKLIKIMPLWAPKVDLSTDATKIKGSTAAQGSGLAIVSDNYLKADGFDNIQLDPTKHSGLTLTNFTLTAYITFSSLAW